MTQPEPDRGDVDTDDVLRRPGFDPEREPAPSSDDERATDAAEASAPDSAAPGNGGSTPEAPD